jgi:hypothetical protein
MSHPVCYTLLMIMKQYEATYTSTDVNQRQGKVILRRRSTDKRVKHPIAMGTYHIMNWHSHSGHGQDLETVQVWNPITKRLFEIYSTDEGETFTFDMVEA